MVALPATSSPPYFYGVETSLTAISDVQFDWKQVLQRQLRLTIAQNHRQTANNVTFEDNTIPLSEERKTRADWTIEQLIRFEDLQADWDGNEAAKPVASSIKDAREFVRTLVPESIVPRPTLHADGHTILFIRGADVYAELEFLGHRHIGFYARRGKDEWTGEFLFDGHTVPEGLLKVGIAT